MQNAATSKPKKKGLKMPHLLVLILSLLVLMSLMTYIIPAGQFGTDPETGAILSDQFHLLGYQTPVNPWRALTLILDGLTSSGMIIGLLLAAGGYTGVVLSTKAIEQWTMPSTSSRTRVSMSWCRWYSSSTASSAHSPPVTRSLPWFPSA